MSKGKCRGPNRSAVSGRYVTETAARARPRTTVHESGGKSGSSGEHYRSAISGRYVTTDHGRRSPHTTIKES
jgi:hypothetical protein